MENNNEKSNIISEQEFMRALGLAPEQPVEPKIEKTPDDELLDILGAGKKKPDENPEPKIEEPKQPVDETKVEEPKKEDEEDKPSEQDIKKEETKSLNKFGVKDTILSLVENDIWSDVALKIGDKEYETLADLIANEKPTKELFTSLSQLQKQLREDKIKSEYVSIKDKDETKVKLINAILSDVEYDDLLKVNRDVVQPITRLDFASQDPTVTEDFVRQCLIDVDGIPAKYVEAELQELKKDFKLIEKAEEYQNTVIQEFNNEIELRQQAQNALRAQEEEKRTSDIKDFRKILKDSDFSDSFIQKAIQLRFSKEEDGYYHYEKLISDKLKDGNFASKFIHFLLDEEDFLKKEKSRTKVETQTKFMELVNVIPKEKGSKQSKEPSTNLSEIDEEFMSIIAKKNN